MTTFNLGLTLKKAVESEKRVNDLCIEFLNTYQSNKNLWISTFQNETNNNVDGYIHLNLGTFLYNYSFSDTYVKEKVKAYIYNHFNLVLVQDVRFYFRYPTDDTFITTTTKDIYTTLKDTLTHILPLDVVQYVINSYVIHID